MQRLTFSLIWGLMLQVLTVSCVTLPSQANIWYVTSRYTFVQGQGKTYDGAEISATNPTTGISRTVVRPPQKVAIAKASLSPDQKYLAYSIGEVWLTNIAGSTIQRIGEPYNVVDFFWLNERNLVLIGTDDPHNYIFPYEGEWILYDSLTQRRQQLTLTGHEEIVPCPTRYSNNLPPRVPLVGKGNLLAHWELLGNTIRPVPDITITSEKLPARGYGCPSWTLDGDKLALAVETPTHTDEIFLISNKGSSIKQLTRFGDRYQMSPFHWGVYISPDGHWVIGQVTLDENPGPPDLPNGKQIVLISTDKQTVEFLGKWETNGGFAWSPDSQSVAVSLKPSNEIHIISVQTKEIKQLTFDGNLKEVFDWR